LIVLRAGGTPTQVSELKKISSRSGVPGSCYGIRAIDQLYVEKRINSPVAATMQRVFSLTEHLKKSSNPEDDIHKAKMSAQQYTFQGWMGLDKDSVSGKMVWQEFEPKTWTEDDVDIKVTHCGICGSDLHTLRSGWVSHLQLRYVSHC
jgi:hypothetical protein